MHPITTLAMTFGERAAYSAKMFLIGQGTIFVALAVLWGALVLFQRLVVKKPKQTAAPAPVTPASVAPVGQKEIGQSDDALIAVITAAVAAAMSEDNHGELPAFRVVSFRQL